MVRQRRRPPRAQKPVPKSIQRAAEIMLGELESQRLTVNKVPSSRRDGAGRSEGLVRVVEQSNPEWYQAFCGHYESARKMRPTCRKYKTAVKRQHTANGLRYLSKGSMGPLQRHPNRAKPYTVRLLPVIRKWIAEETRQLRAYRAASLASVPF